MFRNNVLCCINKLYWKIQLFGVEKHFLANSDSTLSEGHIERGNEKGKLYMAYCKTLIWKIKFRYFGI